MKEMQVVEAVYERDIDFLLVEEFSSNLKFFKYFLTDTKIPLPTTLSNVSILRSKSDKEGEIDIFIEYSNDSRKIVLLIENKIDAGFQKNQAERYSNRKNYYNGEVITFLVAPMQYLNCNHKFDYTVSYESLLPYFKTIGIRGKHKIELLKIAIEKLRRGYIALNDNNRLSFNLAYWECVAEFIDFKMEEPKVVPKRSHWIKLKHKSMPDLNLYHKIKSNVFDIEIPKSKANKYKSLLKRAQECNKFKEFNSVYYIRTILEDKFEGEYSKDEVQTKIRNVLRIISTEIAIINPTK